MSLKKLTDALARLQSQINALGSGTGGGASANKVATSFSAYKSTTKVLPFSSTAFGSTDGDPIPELDLTFTPKSATSKLLVTLLSGFAQGNMQLGIRFAIFLGDASSSAITGDPGASTAGIGFSVSMCAVVPSPGTDPVTFHVRWAVSGGTGTLNGSPSVPQPYAGTVFTTLVVEELP